MNGNQYIVSTSHLLPTFLPSLGLQDVEAKEIWRKEGKADETETGGGGPHVEETGGAAHKEGGGWPCIQCMEEEQTQGGARHHEESHVSERLLTDCETASKVIELY